MNWINITDAYQQTSFAQLLWQSNSLTDLPHTLITDDFVCRLMRVDYDGKSYYMKLYRRAGKYARRLFGMSRARREWRNLFFFQSLGIPIPPIVAYGENRDYLGYQQGLLITESVDNAINLFMLAREVNSIFYQWQWRDRLSKQIAEYVYRLHHVGFIHRDLKWRNILVKPVDDTLAYFFDSTCGKIKKGWFFKHGVIKDLASLDKMAAIYLSKAERLRFYLRYKKAKRLTSAHKKQIKQIVNFFKPSK